VPSLPSAPGPSAPGSRPARAPSHLLDDALARDPARPLVTWYDDASGERIELSAATFANWVAKTAGLLTDGLGAQPGETVRLTAPVDHWQSLVWAVAAWRSGCVLDVYGSGAPPLVSVDGPIPPDEAADGPAGAPADETVALSLRPLGAPFAPGTLPAGALDYAVEVPTHPDRYSGPQPADDDPAATGAAGDLLTGAELVTLAASLAQRWEAGPGARVLVAAAGVADPLELVLAATVVPLVVQGSVVVVRNAGPGGPTPQRVEQERVTVVVS
jgi:uncharacterized protein (TIGR03089 family)